MSGDDRLFAVAPLGGAHLLIAASLIQEIAPLERAEASGWRCVDLAAALDLEADVVHPERAGQALLVHAEGGAAWLLVGRGTRFDRIPGSAFRELPAWLSRARSPLRSLVLIDEEGRFAFELSVERVLERELP